MALPDFLVIGAPKAGSTALHAALAQHPALYMSAVKEPKFFFAWGQKGDKPGEFYSPIGIAFNNKDEVYVTDLNNHVQVYTPEGIFLFLVGDSGSERGEVAKPHGMAFDSHGHLYVADAGNQRIQKFEVPDS